MLLSKNEIRAIDDRKMQTVPVPEWGKDAEVMIRQLSGRDRESYEHYAAAYGKTSEMDEATAQDFYARMAVLSCADEHGNPLFDRRDVGWLTQKSHVALKRIFDATWKFNLFDPEEVDRAADFLGTTPESVSGSDLPLSSEPQ